MWDDIRHGSPFGGKDYHEAIPLPLPEVYGLVVILGVPRFPCRSLQRGNVDL